MATFFLGASILLLLAFIYKLVVTLIAFRKPIQLCITVGEESFIFSENNDENDAKNLIKYFKQ